MIYELSIYDIENESRYKIGSVIYENALFWTVESSARNDDIMRFYGLVSILLKRHTSNIARVCALLQERQSRVSYGRDIRISAQYGTANRWSTGAWMAKHWLRESALNRAEQYRIRERQDRQRQEVLLHKAAVHKDQKRQQNRPIKWWSCPSFDIPARNKRRCSVCICDKERQADSPSKHWQDVSRNTSKMWYSLHWRT